MFPLESNRRNRRYTVIINIFAINLTDCSSRVYRFVVGYKKKKNLFGDNNVTVGDNAMIQRERFAREGPVDKGKKIEDRRIRENDKKRDEEKKRERCDERQRTGMVVADAIRR